MAFRLMVVLAAVPIADMASKDPPVSRISRLVGVAFSVMPISPLFWSGKAKLNTARAAGYGPMRFSNAQLR
jgi:hypothetical protein